MRTSPDTDILAQALSLTIKAVEQQKTNTAAHVKATWDALNRNQRATYAKSLYENPNVDMSQDDIAQAVGVSQGTISNYIAKAKQRSEQN